MFGFVSSFLYVCLHVFVQYMHGFVFVLQHLAIIGVGHLVLDQLCQLTEENTVIQPFHQTVCCKVHT